MKNTLTRKIAYAAGHDAGNRSMRKAGRTVWNEDDFDAATAELLRLLPFLAGGAGMINRILIVGKNSAIPRLRDQKVCPDCGGDGWVFGYEINPSAKPFKVTCGCCGGEGFITKSGAAA